MSEFTLAESAAFTGCSMPTARFAGKVDRVLIGLKNRAKPQGRWLERGLELGHDLPTYLPSFMREIYHT